jgi:hypothetical protein
MFLWTEGVRGKGAPLFICVHDHCGVAMWQLTLFHTTYFSLELSLILILAYKYVLLEFSILAMKHDKLTTIDCVSTPFF